MTARMSFTSVPRVVSTTTARATEAGARVPTRPRRGAPGKRRSFPIQPLAAALALGFAAPSLHALPQGAQVVQGSAQMSQQGSHLQVTNTPGALIQWQSFGIGSGQSVHFQQQSARSAVMNRVTGGSPSEILGTLSSNGRVFLVNGAGIVFGKGAVIDTAGFTASTLNISDADWKAGKVRLQAEGLPGGIAITDVVQVHGDIYLVAPQITNSGALKVHNGQAILAAGQSVSITGRGLEGVQLEVANASNEVLNLGSVEAGAVGMFAGTLRHSGTVQATAVESVDGRVWLKARDSVTVAGAVSARQGDKGGEIVVAAADTRIAAGATLDASGAQGGGQVLIGGGWQGKDASITNAQATTVERGASLRADAIEVGDGGTVVVWSDGHTASHGAISARGGAQGGNGGQVETSGKTLSRSGLPDVSAPQGAAGTWLLDPDQVVIRAGFGGSGLTGDVGAGDAGPTEIFENEIEGYSGNLTIQARKSIIGADWSSGACGSDGILDTPIGGAFKLETTDASCPTSPCGIDLLANGPSLIRAQTLSGSVSAPIGSLEFSAGLVNGPVAGETFKAGVRLGDVSTTAGDVNIRAHGNVEVNSITVDGDGGVAPQRDAGNVVVTSATGMLDIGSISARGALAPAPTGVASGRGGDITLAAFNPQDGATAIVVRGQVLSQGGGVEDGENEVIGGDGGNINITLGAAASGRSTLTLVESILTEAAVAVPIGSGGSIVSRGGDGGDSVSGAAGNAGNGGSITIGTGEGAPADITITAPDGVIASLGGTAGSNSSGSSGTGTHGTGGLVSIQARDIILNDGLYASVGSEGAGAALTVSASGTGGLHLNGGARLLAGSGDSDGEFGQEYCADNCSITVNTGSGGLQGDAAGPETPQIEAAQVSLQSAGDIVATVETFRLAANVSDSASGATVELRTLGNDFGEGSLSVLGGRNLGGTWSLTSVDGIVVSSGARIQARDILLESSGNIDIIGSGSFSESAARLRPSALGPVPSGAVSIDASNSLTLSTPGTLTVDGADLGAVLDAATVDIKASSVVMQGGSSDNAFAAIRYSEALTFEMGEGGTIAFNTGTGDNADAVIFATTETAPLPTIPGGVSCINCEGNYENADPLANTEENFGISRAAVPVVDDGGGRETTVDIPVIQVLVQLQRILEGERFGKVAVEAENVCR